MTSLPNTTLVDTSVSADVRSRIIITAARLLAEQGRDALTTRAVVAAAGVQQPTLYRLFGDKEGLLDAVAEHELAAYVAAKVTGVPDPDPLIDFRAGWDNHVAFGLAHPALFVIIWGDARPSRISPAAEAGQVALQRKIRALAGAGLLRVTEARAVALTHATCTGAVLSLLATPEYKRDLELATLAREAVISAITPAVPSTKQSGPAGAAIALHASLNWATMLTPGERHLLGELLDRIANSVSQNS